MNYRVVMSNFFTEIERCLRSGIAFDLLWDLPEIQLTGYRESSAFERTDGSSSTQNGKRRRASRPSQVAAASGGDLPRPLIS